MNRRRVLRPQVPPVTAAGAEALRETILGAWDTSNRVTVFLVEQLPSGLWGERVPGAPRKTVRMILAHVHNSRCSWIRTLGQEQGIPVPERVDRRTVGRRELVTALRRSGKSMRDLLLLALYAGGELRAPSTYVWRNLPLDVGHVLSYFVAHEGHHRGQVVMLARELGYALPVSTTGGLWEWTRRARESGQGRARERTTAEKR